MDGVWVFDGVLVVVGVLDGVCVFVLLGVTDGVFVIDGVTDIVGVFVDVGV